jgi:hypothetical protein
VKEPGKGRGDTSSDFALASLHSRRGRTVPKQYRWGALLVVVILTSAVWYIREKGWPA